MSFHSLPPELQEAIVLDATRSTSLSLCLTSKAALRVARPLLFRRISLNFSSRNAVGLFAREEGRKDGWYPEWLEMEVSKEEREAAEEIARTQRVKLYEVLKAHPEWCSHVEDLEINLEPETSIGGGETARLFSSFSNLRRLEIASEGPKAPDDETCAFLVEGSCPTVSILDLSQSYLPRLTIYRLIEKLPLLRWLALGPEGTSTSSPAHSATLQSHLPNLRALELWGKVEDRTLFSEIATAAPSLASLQVDFNSLSALEPSLLSPVPQLLIAGTLYPIGTGGSRPMQELLDLTQKIVTVVDGCTSLELLQLVEHGSFLRQFGNPFFGHVVLEHLPRSLRELYIDWIEFTTPALIRLFAANIKTQLPNLRSDRCKLSVSLW
ncbi:hypothetical protein JCM16303_007183 [Sporobolomyces ruberrimus]